MHGGSSGEILFEFGCSGWVGSHCSHAQAWMSCVGVCVLMALRTFEFGLGAS